MCARVREIMRAARVGRWHASRSRNGSAMSAESTPQVSAVGVVGGGIMGSGIAEVAARSGCDVILCEVSEAAAENALARIAKSLAKAERGGKLSAQEREAALGRLRASTDVAELADRDLVVE